MKVDQRQYARSQDKLKGVKDSEKELVHSSKLQSRIGMLLLQTRSLLQLPHYLHQVLFGKSPAAGTSSTPRTGAIFFSNISQ